MYVHTCLQPQVDDYARLCFFISSPCIHATCMPICRRYGGARGRTTKPRTQTVNPPSGRKVRAPPKVYDIARSLSISIYVAPQHLKLNPRNRKDSLTRAMLTESIISYDKTNKESWIFWSRKIFRKMLQERNVSKKLKNMLSFRLPAHTETHCQQTLFRI